MNDPSCLEKCLEDIGLFGSKTSGSGEGFSWDKKMELEDVVEAISNMTTDESEYTKSFWDYSAYLSKVALMPIAMV